MKNTFKTLLCYLLVVSVIFTNLTSYAVQGNLYCEKIVDFENAKLSTQYDSKGFYYPVLNGKRVGNLRFSTAGVLSVGDVNGESVLKYNDKSAAKNTYYNVFSNSDQSSSYFNGRFVYSGKLYTNRSDSVGNMNFSAAVLFVNYSSNGNDYKVNVADKLNKLPANKWYEFRYEIDLDKTTDNISIHISPEDNCSSDGAINVTGSLSETKYGQRALSNLRFDYDLDSGMTEFFVAYKDIKLEHYTGASPIYFWENGNKTQNSFKNGVFTASDTGAGLIAMAVYEDGKLISLDCSYSEEELAERKVNTVIENGQNKKIKIFRFDESNAPIHKPAEVGFDPSDDVRIYANSNFSSSGEFAESSSKYTSDGQLYMRAYGRKSAGSYSRPRYSVSCKNPGRYLIYEADYSIPKTQENTHRVRLIGGYYYAKNGNLNEVDTYVLTTSSGKIYSGRDSKATKTYGVLSSEPTNIALKIDLEENTYDIYINRELVRSGDAFLPEYNMMPGTKYSTRSFYIGHLSGDSENEDCEGTLIVDNVRLYEGTDFIDIGDKIPNVSYLDYSDKTTGSSSEYYERPEAEEIAKKVLATQHPRLMINSQKVLDIKNSKDPIVIDWRSRVIKNADDTLLKEPYKYALSETESIQDLSEGMTRLMNLGMAYLLTGDMKYPNRAYEEVKLLYKVPYVTRYGEEIPEETRDWWNSYNCLDITEISFMVSLCYDWMYDAWTAEQKDELYYHISTKGLDNMYRNYYGMYLPEYTNEDWWKISNNQGSVCNGNAILSGIAFMERDAYRCSQIVEGGIKAIEICLKNFAPDGGWNESASYWAYTLKTFTMACAALESTCGTNYGLQNTPGLKNTCFYSLAIEGDTGSLSYGDGSTERINAPFLFYWAHAFKDKTIGAAAMYMKNERGHTPGIYDLIYYDADYVDSSFKLPETFYYKGIELVTLASGREKSGETYMVMQGGIGHGTGHDHLDSGSIILEMNGQRVFHDSGAEYYDANGYFGSNRHLFFRSRPEAHNIFIINPDVVKNSDGSHYYGQDKNAMSLVTNFDKENKKATMDLTDAYARDAESATRTISLEGKVAVIEDSVTLNKTSNMYWNWYVNVKKNKNDKTFTSGNIEISYDNKTAVITRNDKQYMVWIECNWPYTLEMQAADYYVNVDPEPNGTKHSNETSRRLVVKVEGAHGTVNLKTIVESLE